MFEDEKPEGPDDQELAAIESEEDFDCHINPDDETLWSEYDELEKLLAEEEDELVNNYGSRTEDEEEPWYGQL